MVARLVRDPPRSRVYRFVEYTSLPNPNLKLSYIVKKWGTQIISFCLGLHSVKVSASYFQLFKHGSISEVLKQEIMSNLFTHLITYLYTSVACCSWNQIFKSYIRYKLYTACMPVLLVGIFIFICQFLILGFHKIIFTLFHRSSQQYFTTGSTRTHITLLWQSVNSIDCRNYLTSGTGTSR